MMWCQLIACALLAAAAAAQSVKQVRCNFASVAEREPTILGSFFAEEIDAATVRVTIDVSGLTTNPNAEHGIHIHAVGDLHNNAADGTGTGGHFAGNGAATHGLPSPNGITAASTNRAARHQGDLGNWLFSDGKCSLSKELDAVDWFSGANSIVGLAVVIHADPDDGMGASGNAGSRVAYCAIGLAKPDPSVTNVANSSALENGWTRAVASLRGTSNCAAPRECAHDKAGYVYFEKSATGVAVWGVFAGITPVQAIHIHEFGDLTLADGTSTGGHWKAGAAEAHAFPSGATRHAGDLGNVLRSLPNGGNAYYYYTYGTDDVLHQNFESLFGRGVIVHQAPDCGGDATGQAGSRIFMGTIGYTDVAMDAAAAGIDAALHYESTAFGAPNCVAVDSSDAARALRAPLLFALFISLLSAALSFFK